MTGREQLNGCLVKRICSPHTHVNVRAGIASTFGFFLSLAIFSSRRHTLEETRKCASKDLDCIRSDSNRLEAICKAQCENLRELYHCFCISTAPQLSPYVAAALHSRQRPSTFVSYMHGSYKMRLCVRLFFNDLICDKSLWMHFLTTSFLAPVS